jgi:uridine phosphorylase
MTYLITHEQTLSVVRHAGLGKNSLALSDIAVLTFSMAVEDHLTRICELKEMEWISPRHHPYGVAVSVRRGTYQGRDVIVLVPPMGASPLACILEDLIACGIQVVFLVCAAWSLGPPVEFGDLIIPIFSRGIDATSIYYGNKCGYISADPQVVEALVMASNQRGPKVHIGGNASCEALYRITPQMVAERRLQGCLCMENGEASTVFAVSRELGILGGVLFQPYIDLTKGWNPALLDERYHAVSRIQAEIVLDAGIDLLKGGSKKS